MHDSAIGESGFAGAGPEPSAPRDASGSGRLQDRLPPTFVEPTVRGPMLSAMSDARQQRVLHDPVGADLPLCRVPIRVS